MLLRRFSSFFFFNDTATTEIYTLSLHDALPICRRRTMNDPLRLPGPEQIGGRTGPGEVRSDGFGRGEVHRVLRSEEHTSELQSRLHLVCRLLLEKKKSRPTHEWTRQRSRM